MIRLALLSLALVIAPTAVGARSAAPRVGIASFDQLGTLPLPYDTAADADAQIAAARVRATKAHKRLLIDFGGNWCLDCRILAGVMETPALRGWVARHFEVVTVDVGRFDKNQAIPARYGVKGRLAGVPAVLVVDPRSNRVLNPGRETALADARTMTPQGIADWLAQWTA